MSNYSEQRLANLRKEATANIQDANGGDAKITGWSIQVDVRFTRLVVEYLDCEDTASTYTIIL
jgi:hypothetical protein